MTNIEIEVMALDRAIAHLRLLRDAVAVQSLPSEAFGLRKIQNNRWVAGEPAASYEPGMEDCGK
jgi:hypothetical protein